MVNSNNIEKILYMGVGRSGLENEASIIAQALSELMEHRAIGLTPTMVQDTIRARDIAQKRAIENAHIVDDYQEIGTVEEFKALKEKDTPKKPIYSDFDDNGDDKIIPYTAVCPTCGNEFEFGSWSEEENHHCSCGQRINWVEE